MFPRRKRLIAGNEKKKEIRLFFQTLAPAIGKQALVVRPIDFLYKRSIAP